MVNRQTGRHYTFFKRASIGTLNSTKVPNPQIEQNKQTYDVLFGCPLTNGIRVQAFFAFEWFLTQLETSLSISHESRSKPLTCSTMLISKKFHVYLGAAPLKDLSSASVQWTGRRQWRRQWARRRRRWWRRLRGGGTKKWTRSIQLGIFQPNNQSGLGPLFHHAHLEFFAPRYSPNPGPVEHF